MLDFKKYKDIVYKIIGSAMTVHRELSWGLLEPLYNEAFKANTTHTLKKQTRAFCLTKK